LNRSNFALENDPNNSKKVPVSGTAYKTSKRPFAIWVLTAGLIFSGLDLFYGISSVIPFFFQSLQDPLFDLMVTFIILCFVGAVGSIFMKTWGYLIAGLVSISFIVGANVENTWIPTLRDPQNYNTFIVADTIIPALILVAVLSVLCFAYRNKGMNQTKYLSARSLTGVLSAVVIFLALAGAIGGVYADTLAANTVVNIPPPTSVVTSTVSSSAVNSSTSPSTASSVTAATINSTSTASSSSSGITHTSVKLEATGFIPQDLPGRFDPKVIKVVIGVNNTVTWESDDYLLETVTSNTGLFDSGLLTEGNTWSYTFTSPGTYDYHSTTHPSQMGEVIVVSKT
jgi:plastocyanin